MLPDDLKARLAHARVVHDYEKLWEHMRVAKGSSRPALTDEQRRLRPPATHPIFLTHPITGRKVLYCNPGYATRIGGMDRAESDALLDLLFRHAETPGFQCRFHWKRHSVAFWDNRSALHRAIFDYHPAVRHGHRVTIKGDKPF